MRLSLYAVLFASSFLIAPLCAQVSKPEKGRKPDTVNAPEKGKGDPGTAARSKPSMDDAVTAKDPVIVALDKFIAQKKVSKKNPDWRTSLTEPPKQSFDASREYLWHMQTNKGEITILLLPNVAPMHVTSVIYLTRQGFYDGLSFHRVIKGFMAQGGCPVGNGTGSPGYKMDGEFDDKCKHDKPGILSTANEGTPKTDGSQFFLTFAPTRHLDGKHTICGEVKAGMDAVRALEAAGGTAEADKPTEELVLQRAWVTVTATEAKAEKAK